MQKVRTYILDGLISGREGGGGAYILNYFLVSK